jgi:raffinose/stachyose/melibiose transport system substrate-binding protein
MVSWSTHAGARARRIGAAFLVAALAALLAACGSGTQDKSDGGSSEGGGGGGGPKVTLTLKSITDAKVAWEPLIAAYKNFAPNVTIDASYAPTDQLQTALRAQLGTGNAPDLFVDWPGNGSAMSVQQLAPSGLVADISDQAWVKGVPDGVKPLLGANGKTYMWSPGATPIGILYNKQVFKQVGITDVPKTWPELVADAQKIKAAGKIPFAVGNQTPWVTQLLPYAIAPSTAFAADPNLAQDMLDGKKSFTNSDWHTVYDRYLELYKSGLFNKSPNGTTYEQTQQLLGSGKAAMVVQVIAAMPPFLTAAKSKDDIGTFPFPAADSADALKIPAGVDAGIAASAKGKHLAEAKKFIAWLGRPENMASFSKATYSIPLVGSDPSKTDPLLQPFAPFMASNKTVPFMDQQWPNAKVQPAHFAGVQDLVAGKTDVGGLLDKLDEAYQQK